MNTDFEKYHTHLNVLYNHLEKIDVNNLVKENKHQWYNQTLTEVNDSVVRLGIVEGQYHWHKHDNDDEFFFVLQGKLFIDLESETIELNAGEGITITKGVMHRPHASVKTVMLMVETKSIVPTGS
jgi:mannose-6-phosphate isomerase-like protein (cupin superfamily)